MYDVIISLIYKIKEFIKAYLHKIEKYLKTKNNFTRLRSERMNQEVQGGKRLGSDIKGHDRLTTHHFLTKS